MRGMLDGCTTNKRSLRGKELLLAIEIDMNQKYQKTEKWVSRIDLRSHTQNFSKGTEFVIQEYFDYGNGFIRTDKGDVPVHFIYGFCTPVIETKLTQTP